MKKMFVVVVLGLLLALGIFVSAKVSEIRRRMDALDRNMNDPAVRDAISRAFTGIVHQPKETETK